MLLLRHLKSYLPAHRILRGFVALHLCDFADAIRAGCAEAKNSDCALLLREGDAIRVGCSETNGRALYSNDHAQNNEINRKESYPIQLLNQIALFYES